MNLATRLIKGYGDHVIYILPTNLLPNKVHSYYSQKYSISLRASTLPVNHPKLRNLSAQNSSIIFLCLQAIFHFQKSISSRWSKNRNSFSGYVSPDLRSGAPLSLEKKVKKSKGDIAAWKKGAKTLRGSKFQGKKKDTSEEKNNSIK